MDILEFNINYQLILSVVGTVLAVLLAFLILQFFWLRAKVNRLYRKYKYFMMGEDGGSIEMKLSTEVRELRDMVESSQSMLHSRKLVWYGMMLLMKREINFPFLLHFWTARTMASSFLLWQVMTHPVFMRKL